MNNKRTLLLATRNAGKAVEFRSMLPPDVTILTLNDVTVQMPPETGDTFLANATSKALAAASETGLLTLADDSGLEVDALDGAPGVQSARYAGTPVSDANNREKLLAAMLSVPPSKRTARFRCVVTLARENKVLASADGTSDGQIGIAPRGDGGFGYDSLFIVPGGRSMAEMSLDEKNAISHRGQAYARILPRLLHELTCMTSPTSKE